MKKRYKLVIILLIVCLFLIEESVRFGISSILPDEREVGSIEKSLALNPSDADLNFRLARVYHLLMLGDEQKTGSFYFRSLQLNPLLSSSWLGLAELFADYNDRQKALVALRRSVEVAPFYIARLWEASILAFRLGFNDIAIDNLKVVAKADPVRRMRVIDLCWQLIGEPDVILDKLVTDEYLAHYLGYLIIKDKLNETFPVWDRMKKAGMVSNKIAFHYIDYLAAKDQIAKASSIWAEIFGKRQDASLVWNGGFENIPTGHGSGFDWKLGNAEGVRVDFDQVRKFQGNHSLRLKFDGEHNVNFYHVSQTVPVEPDTNYILSSYIATKQISTRNGISWEVYCHPRINMVKATKSRTETNDWGKVELTFHTPSDCKAVVIRLRRFISHKIDKHIAGTAWVDDVKLFKLGIVSNAQSGKEGI